MTKSGIVRLILTTASIAGAALPTKAQTPPTPPPQPPVAPTSGRAQENVVRQAEDGFGTTIGRESIGIYSPGNVRGFSALAAGNARIDGLFFDQVAAPNPRIRRSTVIRVGLSALTFPFPAPTGVVDYGLIKPGDATSLSATLSGDSYANVGIELDFTVPINSERLTVGGGVALFRNEFSNASKSTSTVAGVSAIIRPLPEIEFQPFWARTDTYDNTIGPLYSPAGDFLPTPVPQRRFFGQDWAQFDGAALLYGFVGKVRPADGWIVDFGLFRSAFLTERDAFVLLDDIQPDGTGTYRVFTDPSGKTASNSGEIRLTHTFAEGPRTHRIIASLRGRDRRQLFGGSDVQDFGEVSIGERAIFAKPIFSFGPQSRDQVQQISGGITYAGRWDGVGEISLGLSKTDYGKRVRRPGLPDAETQSSPFLYNGALALNVTENLAVFAGYTRGLEESGVAPQSATNRNEALPAILTSQRDAGFKWAISEKLKLIGGVFDVYKPYFSRDATGLFTQLGNIRNRGVEMSLSGALTDRLRVVVGGVLLDPDVTGDGVRLGRVGARPVNLPRRKIDVNLDWRTPLGGVSLDLRIANQSRRPANTLNRVFLPDRTLVDIGGRYQFKLGTVNATFRVLLSNIFDVRGFDLFGSGTYDIIKGRVLGAHLAADF